ncbi:MAG: ABC transporter permease [Anaerolineales bacterium]|nr:ABC transporter permease [Anaerolineales bacterium]
MKQTLGDHLRIIWAITSKDLVDALKNKNVLSVLIPAIFIVVMYYFLPGLTAESELPILRIYDQGNPELVLRLEDSPALRVASYNSEADLLARLREDEEPAIALILPAGLEEQVATGSSPELQAYVLHWLSEGQVTELQTAISAELEYLLGAPVVIEPQAIPLDSESYGITVMQILGMVFVATIVGLTVVPHLLLEEKQQKTIDALLVSPAGGGHIILAKALTGLFYACVCVLMALVLNQVLIEHWWLALLGGFLISLFSIALGLLLGVLIENRQQFMLWAWVLILPLFMPMLLVLMEELFPNWLVEGLRWVPTTATFQVLRIAMVRTIHPALYLPQLAAVFVAAMFLLALDAWLVRRMAR